MNALASVPILSRIFIPRTVSRLPLVPMKKFLLLSLTFACSLCAISAQTTPTPPVPQRQSTTINLTEYGVEFQVEPRLIVMMAALEAAGFDPTPGQEASGFRAIVRRDLAGLNRDLQTKLRSFYERNKLPSPATPADQAARYVSLALAMGQTPGLEPPARSEELPASVLEVLDFAPLVQEFYRKSGINERLPAYIRAYQAEGDRLRKPTADMVTDVLSFLHTRPITLSLERVKVEQSNSKKNNTTTYTTRQLERHFYIVPDLLAAPGAINLRGIGDEYYAVVPEGIDPRSSELQRGYLQYVIDPLLLRFNREIAARREPIKELLAEREKAGASVTPDVFLAVARSLVAAADVRFDEVRRIQNASRGARLKLQSAKDDTTRRAITKELQVITTAIQDESAARLSEQYERGAVLAFYFAEQLKGIESSGFDVANFIVDMVNSFDPVREKRRLAENAEARQRAIAARAARLAARRAEAAPLSEADRTRSSALTKKLADIEQVLRLKDYPEAEARLKELMKEYSREPRIFFALAQTASLGAADATDEAVQSERLGRALANYRLAVEAASPETDRPLISRAHEAMGRIYSFMDNNDEAARHFDEAIKIGDIAGGAYKEAVAGKRKLTEPK